MYTWWSLMCTQLLYWRTQHNRIERARKKCNTDRAQRKKYTFDFITFVHFAVICHLCHILFSFLFFLSLVCQWWMNFALLWCFLLEQMVPLGIILQTSTQIVKIGYCWILFIFPFWWKFRATIIICDILKHMILSKRFNSNDESLDHHHS